MKDLRARLGFGALLVAAVVGVFWLDHGAAGPHLTIGVLTALTLLAQVECCRMLTAAGLRPQAMAAFALGLGTLAGAAFGWDWAIASALPLAFYLAFEVMRREPEGAALRLGGTLLAWVLVPLMLSQAIVLRSAVPHGWSWLIFLVAVCKAGDSSAYLIGTAFGRHKLIPEVSPNKSWEGAAASMVFGTLAGWLVVSTAFPVAAAPALTLWLPAALLTNLGAQFGDLVESLIKRSGASKDSATLLPAFGGAFDLVDSFLLASPALVIFLHLAGYSSVG
ncbi:MAG: phosphatidate cytidylyltransferase [Planctomycetota bacterium]|nr:phosphatidate cytidylyltransferase [Planctomycetota bacterium]